jgi:hypothetical protein
MTDNQLEQKAIKQSLLDAAHKRELGEIAESWSETVFNQTMNRSVPFAQTLLLDLF